MVRRKRRKSRKLRGRTRTMGWGRIGQHRKSGSKGGYGAAGMHKHRWTWVVKYAPNWFGKHGFTHPVSHKIEIKEINVGELDEIAEYLLKTSVATREDEAIKIDLGKLGVNKLLGRGKVSKALIVVVNEASEKAIEKIENAGGKVIIAREKSTF